MEGSSNNVVKLSQSLLDGLPVEPGGVTQVIHSLGDVKPGIVCEVEGTAASDAEKGQFNPPAEEPVHQGDDRNHRLEDPVAGHDHLQFQGADDHAVQLVKGLGLLLIIGNKIRLATHHLWLGLQAPVRQQVPPHKISDEAGGIIVRATIVNPEFPQRPDDESLPWPVNPKRSQGDRPQAGVAICP